MKHHAVLKECDVRLICLLFTQHYLEVNNGHFSPVFFSLKERFSRQRLASGSDLKSQVSSWSVFSVWWSTATHPMVAYLHGNKTELATFSIARFRMFPERTEIISVTTPLDFPKIFMRTLTLGFLLVHSWTFHFYRVAMLDSIIKHHYLKTKHHLMAFSNGE